jgi:glycosyltransferase involved in cell wall biosynthesis
MPSPNPCLSVVMPTYNRAPVLGRALDALAACVPLPGGHEVIVVDDGSTDDTASVATRPGVRLLRQPNKGAAAARNLGWQSALAPVVAFIDDDTVPDRGWLVDISAAIEAAPPSVGGVGGAIAPLRDGRMARFVQLERLVGHGAGDDRGVRYLVTANAAFRVDALVDVGGFDEAYDTAAEDCDLGIRLRRAGWDLDVSAAALVRHEHHTGLRAVLALYGRAGAGRARLARNLGEGAAGVAVPMLSPRYWRDRYRYYRSAGGRLTACGFVLLRAAGLTAFLIGYLRERRHR